MSTVPAWQLSEEALAGPEHLDPAQVAAYDAKAQFDPASDLALLKRYGMNTSSTLMDMGAGTGKFALAAAEHARHVTLVDPSEAMLAFARARAEQQDCQNLSFVHSGFLTFNADEPADFIYSRNALHHLPDFWKVQALCNVRANLKSGGVLVLRDMIYHFDPSEIRERLEHWFNHAHHDRATGYTREDLETHVREEFSTFTWLLEPMLARAGFEILQQEHTAEIFTLYVCKAV